MTTPSATTMSERLLDLSDIIRPIAIEETRRYLDSRNLLTKEDFDTRIKSVKEDLKEHIDERLKSNSDLININERLTANERLMNERLQGTERLLLEKQNGLLLRFILTLITVVGIALGVVRWMYPPVAVPATVSTQTVAPSTQTR